MIRRGAGKRRGVQMGRRARGVLSLVSRAMKMRRRVISQVTRAMEVRRRRRVVMKTLPKMA